MPRIKIALITTDERDTHFRFDEPGPSFGVAPSALLEGFKRCTELEIHVITCVRRPVDMPEAIADNIFCRAVTVPAWGFLRAAYVPCILRIRRILRRLQPAVVHGQGTERYCALAATFSGYPNVITLHGNMVELARSGKARAGTYLWCAAHLEDFALRRTGGVFCNSRHTQSLVAPRTSRTWLVPNAVRGVFFASAPRHRPGPRTVLLNVGVICENKQQLELLRMARSLREAKLDFELRFIGAVDRSSPYGRRFLDEAQRGQQDGFARYVGTSSAEQLVQCFDGASALVHTPVSESFGLVVAEALARDLKIFGFRVGGVPDITEGAGGAVLVEPDDWAGLEEAVANWLRAGSRPPGSSSDLMRNRYHEEAVAREHVRIYRELT